MSQAHGGVVPKPLPPPLKNLTIEYLGFRNADDRREFRLCARVGAEAREFTFWISHAAFAAGWALIQDGPDICYQKLRRELVGAELAGESYVEVTRNELSEYRAAHAPATRRSLAPPAPERRG